MECFTGDIKKDSEILAEAAGFGRSYDVKERKLKIGCRDAYFCYIGSLVSDLMIEKLIKSYQNSRIEKDDDAASFAERCAPFGDVKFKDNAEDTVSEIFEGSGALLIDGIKKAIVSDAKNIPSRGIEEPESDRVLRGARDGFTEKLLDNTALLRQRLRVQELVFEKYSVGLTAKTTVVLCYFDGRADKKFVSSIADKLKNAKVDALSMSSESLAECIIKKQWYNPFPKIRYTERPDAAAAMILEGSVIVLCDNSPQAMILPCSIFDFMQETDDFYFPPLTGTYLRLVRFFIFLLSYAFVPVWYLLIKNPSVIPEWLDFIKPAGEAGIPIFFQIMLVEFMIDGLKLASMNTPGSLNNSLSIVAGLLLGDYAIEVGWFIPEVILYMSFVAMANFTQPSFELGYAFKYMRVISVVLTELFNYAGFAVSVVFTVLSVALNNSVDGGRSYLYPVIPFNKEAFLRLFFRVRLADKKKEVKRIKSSK